MKSKGWNDWFKDSVLAGRNPSVCSSLAVFGDSWGFFSWHQRVRMLVVGSWAAFWIPSSSKLPHINDIKVSDYQGRHRAHDHIASDREVQINSQFWDVFGNQLSERKNHLLKSWVNLAVHSFIDRNQKQETMDYFKQSTTRLFFIADKCLGKQTFKQNLSWLPCWHAMQKNRTNVSSSPWHPVRVLFHWYVDPVSKDIMWSH